MIEVTCNDRLGKKVRVKCKYLFQNLQNQFAAPPFSSIVFHRQDSFRSWKMSYQNLKQRTILLKNTSGERFLKLKDCRVDRALHADRNSAERLASYT